MRGGGRRTNRETPPSHPGRKRAHAHAHAHAHTTRAAVSSRRLLHDHSEGAWASTACTNVRRVCALSRGIQWQHEIWHFALGAFSDITSEITFGKPLEAPKVIFEVIFWAKVIFWSYLCRPQKLSPKLSPQIHPGQKLSFWVISKAIIKKDRNYLKNISFVLKKHIFVLKKTTFQVSDSSQVRQSIHLKSYLPNSILDQSYLFGSSPRPSAKKDRTYWKTKQNSCTKKHSLVLIKITVQVSESSQVRPQKLSF